MGRPCVKTAWATPLPNPLQLEQMDQIPLTYYVVAATTALVNLVFRYYLTRTKFSKKETPGRMAATLSTFLIVGVAQGMDLPHGVTSFLSYMLADTLCSLLFGPSLDLLMFLHHAVCIFISLAYFHAHGHGVTPEVVESVPMTLLLMEVSNPFLHASIIVDGEEAYQPWKALVLPVSGPGLLLTFFWFRVIQCPRCIPIVWQHRADFAPMGEVYTACLAGLSGMQLFWFWKILKRALFSEPKKSWATSPTPSTPKTD